jgi:hypothetical protein
MQHWDALCGFVEHSYLERADWVRPEAVVDALDGALAPLRALEAEWALSRKLAAPAPEQFWRLAPPPAGWEGLQDAR